MSIDLLEIGHSQLFFIGLVYEILAEGRLLPSGANVYSFR